MPLSITPGEWPAVGDPQYLRQCVRMSLRRLKLERIDLWQLRRIDPMPSSRRTAQRRGK